MGRYSYELFRACRLVVDTGLHAKDWPRERAIQYLVNECGSSEAGATSEVLRYMAWPGQALGYKIGELTIRDIRANAESASVRALTYAPFTTPCWLKATCR